MSESEIVLDLQLLGQQVKNYHLTEDEFAKALEGILKKLAISGLRILVEVYGEGKILASYGRSIAATGIEFQRSNDPLGSVSVRIVAERLPDISVSNSEAIRDLYQEVYPILLGSLGQHWGTRDSLTYLINHKAGDERERLRRTVLMGMREERPIIAVHLDLDRFKTSVNDKFGESIGDQVIGGFASRVRETFAAAAIIVRKGGEEFSMFFQGRSVDSVLMDLEKFRRRMEKEPFQSISSPNTCSMGVAVHTGQNKMAVSDTQFDDLWQSAMSAERLAKTEGRNCIRLSRDGYPEPVQTAREMITTGEIIECALWSRCNLLQSQEPPFGDCVHNYLGKLLFETFSGVTLAQLSSSYSAAVRSLGLQTTLDKTYLTYTPTGASPYIHAVKMASIALHAMMKNALAGRGPLQPADKLFMGIESANGAKKYLVVKTRCSDGSVHELKISDLNEEQESFEVFVGRPWLDRKVATEGAILQWVPESSEPVSLSPCLLLAIGGIGLPAYPFHNRGRGRSESQTNARAA